MFPHSVPCTYLGENISFRKGGGREYENINKLFNIIFDFFSHLESFVLDLLASLRVNNPTKRNKTFVMQFNQLKEIPDNLNV